jgi:hypothetical protein
MERLSDALDQAMCSCGSSYRRGAIFDAERVLQPVDNLRQQYVADWLLGAPICWRQILTSQLRLLSTPIDCELLHYD